jgi:hypothetical protein
MDACRQLSGSRKSWRQPFPTHGRAPIPEPRIRIPGDPLADLKKRALVHRSWQVPKSVRGDTPTSPWGRWGGRCGRKAQGPAKTDGWNDHPERPAARAGPSLLPPLASPASDPALSRTPDRARLQAMPGCNRPTTDPGVGRENPPERPESEGEIHCRYR